MLAPTAAVPSVVAVGLLSLTACAPAPVREALRASQGLQRSWDGKRYTLSARVVSGDLVAQGDSSFTVRYAAGRVLKNGVPLEASLSLCADGRLADGNVLRFDDAHYVILEMPGVPCGEGPLL